MAHLQCVLDISNHSPCGPSKLVFDCVSESKSRLQDSHKMWLWKEMISFWSFMCLNYSSSFFLNMLQYSLVEIFSSRLAIFSCVKENLNTFFNSSKFNVCFPGYLLRGKWYVLNFVEHCQHYILSRNPSPSVFVLLVTYPELKINVT